VGMGCSDVVLQMVSVVSSSAQLWMKSKSCLRLPLRLLEKL